MNHPNPLTIRSPFDIPDGTYRQQVDQAVREVNHELDLMAIARRYKSVSPLERLLNQYRSHPVITLKSKVMPTIIGEWKKSWHEALSRQVPDMALANRYLDELELLERTVDKIK